MCYFFRTAKTYCKCEPVLQSRSLPYLSSHHQWEELSGLKMERIRLYEWVSLLMPTFCLHMVFTTLKMDERGGGGWGKTDLNRLDLCHLHHNFVHAFPQKLDTVKNDGRLKTDHRLSTNMNTFKQQFLLYTKVFVTILLQENFIFIFYISRIL